MRYPYAAGRITTGQMTASGTPTRVNAESNRNTNRVLLMASAAGAYVGGSPNITASTGAAIPTTNYLELWVVDPAELYIVGAQTVYYILEEPERPQAS